jgi:hypothetical protein
LQLPPWLGFESDYWFIWGRRSNRAQVLFKLRDAAFVSVRTYLSQEHRRRQLDLAGGLNARQQVAFVRVEFGRTSSARTILAIAFASKDRPNRIARNAGLAGNRADALALPVQDVYLHLKLLIQHANRGSLEGQVGQFSTGGVGQFYSGANNFYADVILVPNKYDEGSKLLQLIELRFGEFILIYSARLTPS